MSISSKRLTGVPISYVSGICAAADTYYDITVPNGATSFILYASAAGSIKIDGIQVPVEALIGGEEFRIAGTLQISLTVAGGTYEGNFYA